MITETGKVIEAKKLSDGIYSLWIKTAAAKEAIPGQFVAVYPKGQSLLLQRPISICEIAEDKTALRIVYRVAGKGTAEFSGYSAGDDIRLLGPCGNGYDTEKLITKEQSALLVGGGIGVPPMLELGKQLNAEGKSFKFVMGYRNADMFLYEELVACAGKENVIIATDDGSVGTHGTVVDAIKAANVKADMIMSCGPLPMLRALKVYAKDNAMKAYISLEERMACGVGACLGCVCKTTKKDDHSHVNNARVCMEGPVFDAEDVEI